MTTKRVPKAKTQPSRSSPDEFKGFVNISLTDSLKEDILNEQEDIEALERHVDSLLAAGFKVTLSFDAESSCYQATATGTKNAGKSAGYATSARSEDITRSILALSGKVLIIADGDLSTMFVERKTLADI